MANYLYVRTELTVPGVGSAIHMAEMEEQDARSCRMVRMIALDPSDAIVGVATPTSSTGNVDQPQEVVPHPDTYDDFPDIRVKSWVVVYLFSNLGLVSWRWFRGHLGDKG